MELERWDGVRGRLTGWKRLLETRETPGLVLGYLATGCSVLQLLGTRVSSDGGIELRELGLVSFWQ